LLIDAADFGMAAAAELMQQLDRARGAIDASKAL